VETQVRFVFDPPANHLTAHAFASGFVPVVAHNPRCAVRDSSGEARCGADALARSKVRRASRRPR